MLAEGCTHAGGVTAPCAIQIQLPHRICKHAQRLQIPCGIVLQGFVMVSVSALILRAKIRAL